MASPTGFARDGEVEDYSITIEKVDVVVKKEAATTGYTPGSEVTYTVTYENAGNVPATAIKATDLLEWDSNKKTAKARIFLLLRIGPLQLKMPLG